MPTIDGPDRTPAEPTGPADPPRPEGVLPAHGATPEQVDAEFARIVAGFDAPVGTPTWPTPEETGGDAPHAERPRGPIWPAAGPVLNRGYQGDPRGVGPGDPSLLDGLDSFGTGLPDDTPDEFVRPAPPPLPDIPIGAVFGVLCILIGLVLFFDNSLLPVSDQFTMLLGLAGIIGGAVSLILRLRPGGEDDELPPDDGAVV